MPITLSHNVQMSRWDALDPEMPDVGDIRHAASNAFRLTLRKFRTNQSKEIFAPLVLIGQRFESFHGVKHTHFALKSERDVYVKVMTSDRS